MDTDHGIEKEAIPFHPSGETTKSQFIEVKYTISGSSFKTQSTIFCGSTNKEFLRFLNKFSNAKGKLAYTMYQKLESGIEQLLQGTANVEWTTIKGTIQAGTNNLAAFDARIEAFRKIYIPKPAAIDYQKAYLQRIKKNDKMSVPHFLDQLKQINLLLAQFPNSSPQNCFSDKEIKRLFYFAMPMRWRTNFINSGQSLYTSSIESLRTINAHLPIPQAVPVQIPPLQHRCTLTLSLKREKG